MFYSLDRNPEIPYSDFKKFEKEMREGISGFKVPS
jgi:hypothetical protein